ncbi:hypothetical protein PRK78_001212 [Emydomyces testavorans]|uniref:Uncharacterized protein n=1 Tax=Emydomyces testavorans TaxID=2070801 RepID=A0AAF0DC62_9EURO|nr:hypothetical protein PRK78_001212 [Emydomyces testavorans]
MWLFRGAQSAVFYYASCTPCGESSYKRKRRRDAARTVREPSREGIVTDQPVLFHQPFPFTTNSYWSEEISLGPGPPSRKGHRNGTSRSSSQRNLVSPETPADPAVLTGVLQSLKKDKDALKNPIGDAWNKIRYQREDEELWGVEIKGSSVGLSGRGRSDTHHSSKYYLARNPEVNDLHPPVACGPRSRAETRWMLQPPPSAKVMAGKVRLDTSVRQNRDTSPRAMPLPIPEESESPKDIGPLHNKDTHSSRQSRPQAAPVSIHEPNIPQVITSNSDQQRKQRPRGALSPIPSFDDSGRLPGPSDSSLQSPPAALSTVPFTSRLTPSTQTSENIYLSPSPKLQSRSNSPVPRSPRVECLKVPSPVLLRKTASMCAEDRPSTNGTTDSGKAFHPRTPSTPASASHTNKTNSNNNTKPYLGLQLEMGVDDFSDDDISDLEDLQHIRPYRWSMDI